MARLQAKKISAAIKKAQGVGQVEEPLTIDGCKLVLRSLTNPEYIAITEALEELEDVAYAVAFREEHLCRSIVEIDGESLRDVDYVEIEVTDDTGSVTGTQLLERHQFIKDCILSTWSREAMDVGARKFNELVEKAEKQASAEVVFNTAEETAEEMYRRLLAEAKDIEGNVPYEMATKIRDEVGFLLKQEWTSADDKLSQIKVDLDEPVEETPVRVAAQPAPVVHREPEAPKPNSNTILRKPATGSFEPAPTPSRSAPVPVMPPMNSPVTVSPTASQKSAELAALEGDLGQTEVGTSPHTAYNPHATRPAPRNPVEAMKILDQPPVGGINPRFKAPPKL